MRSPRWRFVVAAVLLAAGLTACTSSGPPVAGPGALGSSSASAGRTTPASTPAATPTPTPTPLGAPVNVSSVEGDGQTFGVGMPVIIRFSVSPTDKSAFETAATVTVNGAPVAGAWFWEKPFADSPIEVHYRPQSYWPAYAKIHVGLPLKGLSAGPGLSYANDLTLDYSIGAYHYSTVDANTLQMTVYSDGAVVRTIPVSLGKGTTPTYSGIKIAMQKDNPVRMIGPGYDELVAYSVRLTNSGEYVHAAPWNSRIGQVSTSNGCTNLSTDDAAWFYNFTIIGDVVQYPNAAGGDMPSWDGYGDWNVDWSTWQAGGAL